MFTPIFYVVVRNLADGSAKKKPEIVPERIVSG
jgi:hypothetical protein